MPQTPNFKKGVGQLATDRYDFQKHLDGTNFRHKAGQIDLSPAITINSAVFTDVQSLLGFLSGTVIVPTVPNATTSSVGVIQLGGDLNGTGTTAIAPKVGALQGFAVSPSAPVIGQFLSWNGTSWTSSAINQATNALPVGGIVLAGDLGGGIGGPAGSAASPVVTGLQTRPVLSTAPTTGQVLGWNGSAWAPASAAGTPAATTIALGTVQLAGDLGGTGTTATAPRVSGINGATVPASGALTTGNVLQVSGASALTYNFIADANVSPTAAIQGSKIAPNFGTQSLTAGPSNLGSTTTGTLTAGTATSANSLFGSIVFTTRTIASNLVIDTTTTDNVIFVNTGSGAIQITMPAPTNGRRLIIKDSAGNAATNNISILQHSAEKIEGLAATKILSTNWGSWTFVSNGVDWFMI